MRIAGVINDSISNGEGFRFVVFTQGCVHKCAGCHNEQTHNPLGGYEVSTRELVAKIVCNPLCSGLTLSGGEPFEQAAECAELAQLVRNSGKNVWTYTGYTIEQLKIAEDNSAWQSLLCQTDVLVDGRFELSLQSTVLKWRGSANQRLWRQITLGEWSLDDL